MCQVSNCHDFQEGRLKLPLESAEYVEALRKVAVDLRKSNTNVNQLACYLKIHNKIQELGVGTEDIGDWLEVSRELASSISGNRFKEVALEMSQLKKEKGLGYAELLEDYRLKWELLGATKEEITEKKVALKKLREDEEQARLKTEKIKKNLAGVQRNCSKQKLELKQGLERYLKDSKLSWERIKKVEAFIDSSLIATGLTQAAIDGLRSRIIDAGSLLQVIEELEKTKQILEEQAGYLVAHHEHNYNELALLVREREQSELTVKNLKRDIAKLVTEIESKKMELGRLDKIIYENRERIYVCESIIDFLFARNGISEAQLDKLVNMFIALRKIRLGIGPRIVTDADDKVVCKCEVPKELGGSELQGLDGNKVREAFAYAIAPIVDDKFVPRIDYDIALFGGEVTEKIAELRKVVEKITRGSTV